MDKMKIYKSHHVTVRVIFSKTELCDEVTNLREQAISLVETSFQEVEDRIKQLYGSFFERPQGAILKDRTKITIKELDTSGEKPKKKETSFSAYGIDVDSISILINSINN